MAVSLWLFIQVFQGNSERQIVVISRFRTPIRARFVKLYPRTWHGHISMRLELYSCSKGKINVGGKIVTKNLSESFPLILILFKSKHENICRIAISDFIYKLCNSVVH